MDPITGLPIAFGKQPKQSASSSAGPSKSTEVSEANGVNRGESGGRGARGIVGGGKRNRGRGRGGPSGTDGHAGQPQNGQDSEITLNGGVKRPHPFSHTSLPAPPAFLPPNPGSTPYPTSNRHNPNNMDLGIRGSIGGNGGMYAQSTGVHGNIHAFQPNTGAGGRGRGGGRGGRGGGGGGRGGGGGGGAHAPPEKGFYKPSFVEDPWKALLEARERSRG